MTAPAATTPPTAPREPDCRACTRQMCMCPLPDGPAIDESNRRAAEQRARLASPLDRMDGSGM